MLLSSCNDAEKNDSLNKVELIGHTIHIIGDYETTIGRLHYGISIVNGIVQTITVEEGTLYYAPQVIKCDSEYPATTIGKANAARRVEELKNTFDIPCADYYLCYNKKTGEYVYLVLYTTEGPCDWYDNLK